MRAPPDPAMASVHSSVRYSRRPPSLRQRCPRPQSARRIKRVSGRRGNARRKKRGGSLTPVAPTLRLQVRKQTPSPSSPRARATHGDRDYSGGSFRKLKRVQTRPAVQHLPRRLRAGPPTPAQIQEPALRSSADRAHPDMNQGSPVPNLAQPPRTSRHCRAAFPDFRPQMTEQLRQESSKGPRNSLLCMCKFSR